jgi:16S rRNA (cytosine967-C5)-methyltransferase
MDREGLGTRAAALQVLTRVLEKRLFLEEPAASKGLSSAERAFAHRLVVTALRHWGHLSLIKSWLIERPLQRQAVEADRLISLGLAQMLYLDIAPHAAVSTSVDLAAASSKARIRALKGLVNAVLRRAADEREILLDRVAKDPLANLPGWLNERWCTQFGEDVAARLAIAHSKRPPLDLTFASIETAEKWVAEHGGQSLIPGSVRLKPKGAISDLPGYRDGDWWVQDLAAGLPVRLLGNIERFSVADLCAAPGGKTLQLAAAGANVTAIDRSPGRLNRLQENLSRCHLTAEIVAADALDWQPGLQFDLVLLDAPCSANGTIRRHPELPWIREGFDLDTLTDLQDGLMKAAWKLVQPGGRLLYCVCSLEPAECLERTERFLERTGDAKRQPLAAPGITGSIEVVTAEGDFRTWPMMLDDKGGMDGFYAACLVKNSA